MKKELLSKVLMAMMMVLVLSCSSDDSDDESNSNWASNKDAQYEKMLMGTSWELTDGTLGTVTYGYNHIWYLMNAGHSGDEMSFYKNADGTWEVTNGKINVYLKHYDYNASSLSGARMQIAVLGFLRPNIITLTDNKLVTSSDVEGDVTEYRRVSYKEGSILDGNGSGADNGSSSGGEPPYVTSFDFTATKSSITVKFMCNERPTSATVKYGTSSPNKTASSSITGKQVSATVTGLKSGTTYYFKCTVKNSYGSSTSDTFYAITNY